MSGLRIGVLKPDFGAAGGFERLLDRLVTHLIDANHDVRVESFPGLITARESWGIGQSRKHWSKHSEFFRYMGLVEDVRRIDLSAYDLVLSTQPPTFLADHPKILALFYHHARIFYDLAEPFVALDEVDASHHARACKVVQETDEALKGGVRHWLAGSPEVRGRLDTYWGITEDVSLLHAPPLTNAPVDIPNWNRNGPVLCVSRHEWPKRTELMVAAAHLVDDREVHLIGGGGRMASLRQLDAKLTADPNLLSTVEAADLWKTSALDVVPPAAGTPSRARLLGTVSDRERDLAYASASVFVAPAYREDYGLTVLEAMLWERPVIVCEDGGGLADIVRATGAGLIVEPTPQAIADGVRRITEDVSFARQLIEQAKAVPSVFTWERANAELDAAIHAAMSR